MDAAVTKPRPITIAVLALGGEGGGVLADWIVDVGEHSGYLAQTTSIPGVAQRTGAAARDFVAFDMAAMADATGSVISAVLFGALAGSGALPLQRGAFEAAIRRGRVGVKASLMAFGAGFEAAQSGVPPVSAQPDIG